MIDKLKHSSFLQAHVVYWVDFFEQVCTEHKIFEKYNSRRRRVPTEIKLCTGYFLRVLFFTALGTKKARLLENIENIRRLLVIKSHAG